MKVTGRYIDVRIILGLLFCSFVISCSTVKYVPENNYLLNKVDVKIDNKNIDRSELQTYIKQKENLKILGFLKFHLWLYNLSSPKKNDGWLKKIGEEPQLFSEILNQRSVSQVKQYLNNKGYYNASVVDYISKNDRKRKLDLVYEVNTGDPYLIQGVKYTIPDPELQAVLKNDSMNSMLKKNRPFDVDLLDKERERISRLFRNNGYYYFSKDLIYYTADSSRNNKRVFLNLIIRSAVPSGNLDSLAAFRKYKLNRFFYNVLPISTGETTFDESRAFKYDSIKWDNSVLYYSKFFRYKPDLLSRMNKLEGIDLFNLNKAEETFTAFNRLRQFRYIDIKFNEPVEQRDSNLLDCHFNLAPLTRQSTSFDLEGTNTSGNLGIAGNLNYLHRNLFHGAELLSFNIKGAMERQQAVVQNVSQDFNTREFGVESNISVPRLIGPGKLSRSFDEALPKTVFTLGFNYQRRPDYTRTIYNFKIGYDWWSSANLRKMINIVDFNMVNLYNYDPDFINSIKDLYIKSSFTDHLIFAVNYSFIYNDRPTNVRTDYKYAKFSIESAGNLFYLLSSVAGREKYIDSNSDGFYRIFNTRFAQYLKTDLELRQGRIIDKYNSIVGRAFIGIGLPYGNFDVLPFEKKYFTGGANGIRAWQVRSLGPGTYKEPKGSYPNESSDIKLEFNLEYRFRLISFLEGALFADAGNIWSINDKDNREGAQFKLNKFYRQLALGTGTGLRLDASYFIFRLDLGLKLRDPAQSKGNGWIPGVRRVTSDDLNLSFAIGYPF